MENPSSRVEHYLSAMLGNEACPGYPEHTRTRIENYLEAICHRSISVNVMPTASEAVEGRIFQYVGETTTQYTQGYFYLCVNNACTNDYQWLQIDVQPDLTVGRYLANWNATTGLPVTNPGSLPYTYSTGDYYIISTVGSTNYKPTGTTYSGTASTEEETEGVTVGDYYFFDGTVWKLVGGSNAINNIIAAISNATTAQKTEIAEALPAVHQHVLTQAQLDTLIQAGTLIDGDWYGVTD